MALILEKHKMPVQDPKVRAHNFEEVALGYDEDTAVAEAERCLHCNTVCQVCADVCPNRANVVVTMPDGRHEILQSRQAFRPRPKT